MKKTPKLTGWLIYKLRRISLQWPARNIAKQQARVEGDFKLKKDGTPGKRKHISYKCAECQELFPPSEVQMDHITPIVPESGFDSWDGVINRLFCEPEAYQCLCSGCHDEKSRTENKGRVKKRKKK